MRNIERIDEFCLNLAKQWKKYPDFRFGQMMMVIFGEMSASGRDPFHPEDDEMMQIITKYMSQFGKNEDIPANIYDMAMDFINMTKDTMSMADCSVTETLPYAAVKTVNICGEYIKIKMDIKKVGEK